MTKPEKYKLLKLMIFLWIVLVLSLYVSKITGGYDNYNFQQFAGFFEEAKDSLDAVYIGASPTFTSWVAPLAYGKYGIAVRTFANDNQPFVAVESLLRIARKEQPNAVFMIAINGLYDSDEVSVEAMHWTTDFFPYSIERFKLVDEMCDDFQYTFEDRCELLFPFIRYHLKENVLSGFFSRKFENLKGGYSHPIFLSQVEDISGSFNKTTKRNPLPDFTQKALEGLLDYCKEEDIKVVFILSAQYRNELLNSWYNTITDEIKAYGFPLVDEMANFNNIGLDAGTDFYNIGHTNIHGALKITDYLSQYLIEKYAFEDKRGNSAYADWEEAYKLYSEIIKPYLTEEELMWISQ